MYKHVYCNIVVSGKTLKTKINAHHLTKNGIGKKLQGSHTKEDYAAILKKALRLYTRFPRSTTETKNKKLKSV